MINTGIAMIFLVVLIVGLLILGKDDEFWSDDE